MGGKSKSKSSSTNTTTTNTSTLTKTNNLSLDGVEGVTIAGSKGVTINQTAEGAFDVVEAALDAVTNNANQSFAALAQTTQGSLDKVNQSNASETAQLSNKFTLIAVAGLGVWAFIKIKGK